MDISIFFYGYFYIFLWIFLYSSWYFYIFLWIFLYSSWYVSIVHDISIYFMIFLYIYISDVYGIELSCGIHPPWRIIMVSKEFAAVKMVILGIAGLDVPHRSDLIIVVIWCHLPRGRFG
jgi:hypothetical protein